MVPWRIGKKHDPLGFEDEEGTGRLEEGINKMKLWGIRNTKRTNSNKLK